MKIEMPKSDEAVESMIKMLVRADVLRARQQELLDRMKELRDGIGMMLPPAPVNGPCDKGSLCGGETGRR